MTNRNTLIMSAILAGAACISTPRTDPTVEASSTRPGDSAVPLTKASSVKDFRRPNNEFRPVALSMRPGMLVIDASESGTHVPMPERGRHFSSEQDLFRSLQTHLGGVPIMDKKTSKVIGVGGEIIQYGRLMTMVGVNDKRRAPREVEDVVAEFLGGQDGYFIVQNKGVADSTFCVDPTRCTVTGVQKSARDSVQRPQKSRTIAAERTVCNNDETFCIKNRSWKKDWAVYFSVGSETVQEKGGYQEDWKVCWWSIFPYPCKKGTGRNVLELESTFSINNNVSHTVDYYENKKATKKNVTNIKISKWAIFASPIKRISGVCSRHKGSGTGGSVSSSLTQKGEVRSCP